MHQKRTSEALCMFERAVSAGEESETTSEPYRHALYWLGVVLEQDGRFLNAIERYRAVQSFSAQLAPEAMYRELRSLSSIGRFEDALRVVLRFPDSPPPGLEPKRFDQLRTMMNEEQDQLSACLRDAAPEELN